MCYQPPPSHVAENRAHLTAHLQASGAPHVHGLVKPIRGGRNPPVASNRTRGFTSIARGAIGSIIRRFLSLHQYRLHFGPYLTFDKPMGPFSNNLADGAWDRGELRV
jgi:hypothetical protein